MREYDALVIGGGINGIAAACVMSKNGKSVALLEQRNFLGGMATHNRIGPPAAHLLWNVSSRMTMDIGLGKHGTRDLIPVETICFCERGKHIRINQDNAFYLDGSSADADRSFKNLTKRLLIYGSLLKQLAENMPYGIKEERSSLKEIMRILRFGFSVKSLGKPQMRKFLQDLLMNVSDFILDDIQEGPLAGLMAADATRGLFSGPRNPGTVFNLIYRYGHGGEITRPSKGMKNYFEMFEEKMINLNVDVKINSKARHILIDNDSVKGIELANGQKLLSSTVLCSSGLHSLKDLVGVTPFDIEGTRRIRNLRTAGTTAKVNLKLSSLPIFEGVCRPLTDYRFIIAPSVNYVEQAFNPCKYGETSDTPVCESVFIVEADTIWLSSIVQFIPKDLKSGWNNMSKNNLKTVTVKALSRFLPGLNELIEKYEVITPDNFADDLGVMGGNWHQCEMGLGQIYNLRPTPGFSAYTAGPEGLYLCGSSSHPGGDIMGLSGRNAALRALRKIS